ncbi:uncharacterized protein [Pyrus communis]|uniref:uncharacterized protein n=1 Tax=Pyrus communis TaxID=23211 RepID=UPI0035C1EB32
MKLKEKFEETRKEFLCKRQAFEHWYEKYVQRHAEMDQERGEDVIPKDLVSEKKFIAESLKKRMEEECEAHQRHCIQVRDKSLRSLKTRLPEIFRAMTNYTNACSITLSASINGEAAEKKMS